MKNVQVIDGATNSEYAIFAFTEEEFDAVFPNGQDIEFIENIYEQPHKNFFNADVWKRRVDKKNAVGIHGTLFYELRDQKQKYYPNKKESDLDLKLF